MYSPTQGRFITADPIGFQAGDVNLYRFVENNPANKTDPSGLVLQGGDDLREFMFGGVGAIFKAAGNSNWAPPKWPNANSIRVEPRYTEHQIEWYARLWDISKPAKPRIVLDSYFGFDVEIRNGKPVLQATPVEGALIQPGERRGITVRAQYDVKSQQVQGKEELQLTYVLTVTDQNDPTYTARYWAEWKFTVENGKLKSEMLSNTPEVRNPKALMWADSWAPGKTNRETYTKEWQEAAAAFRLYGEPKK